MKLEGSKCSLIQTRQDRLVIEDLLQAIAPLFGVIWSRGVVKSKQLWREAVPRLS